MSKLTKVEEETLDVLAATAVMLSRYVRGTRELTARQRRRIRKNLNRWFK